MIDAVDVDCRDTYMNPILFGSFPNPSILRDGADFFQVHAGMDMKSSYQSLLMWHSNDLVHLRPLYYLLDCFEDEIWAPELVKYEDVYYIYIHAAINGRKQNCVLSTQDILNGPWTLPAPILGLEGIDPGHVVGEDGKRYLFMSKNVVYPLSNNGMAIAGEGRKVYGDWTISDDWDIEGICRNLRS